MGEQAEKYYNRGALTEVRGTEKSTYSFTFILYLWAFVGGSGTKHNCDRWEQNIVFIYFFVAGAGLKKLSCTGL